MISPRDVTAIRELVKWARDDVSAAGESPRKKIRRGYVRLAKRSLDEAIAKLDALVREAWEDDA